MARREEGQSLVEFALILPLLLLLLVGIFDFGRIFYTHLHLELITQESVRMGGLGQNDETIRSHIHEQFTMGDSGQLKIKISPSEGSRKSGEYMTVEITYPDKFFNVLGGAAISYDIKTKSTIRVE